MFESFLALINCEKQLDLSCSENGVISELSRIAVVAANPPNPSRRATETTGSTFKTKSAKLHAPVVMLSRNNNIKFLENRKQGFKRTVSTNIDLK